MNYDLQRNRKYRVQVKSDTSFKKHMLYVQYNIRHATTDLILKTQLTRESEHIMPENAKPEADNAMNSQPGGTGPVLGGQIL